MATTLTARSWAGVPWRPWEVASQILVTALCGLAATLAWLALGGGVVGNVDFIALATLFTAVVGASLAWYLPYAQGRGHRNRTFHKSAWALTQAACSRSSLSAAQWRVGKGEIAANGDLAGPQATAGRDGAFATPSIFTTPILPAVEVAHVRIG